MSQKYLDRSNAKDPWGKDLLFRCPGTNDTDSADISSAGPDKQEGTPDDIKSWEHVDRRPLSDSRPRRDDGTWRARRDAGGFTLIEIMVAMMVLALIVTSGCKGFRTVTKSDLRRVDARTCRARSATCSIGRRSTGKYHRLVIDLNEGKYWAEVSDDRSTSPNQAETERTRRKREEKEAAADEEQRKRQEKQQLLYGNGRELVGALRASSSSFDMSKLEVGEFRPKRARFAAFKETALKPVTLKKLKI